MRRILWAMMAIMAAACSPQSGEEVVSAPTPEPVPVGMPRTQCWFNEDARVTEGLTVTFEGSSASGEHFGVVHDEENAYFTSFSTVLSAGASSDGEVWTFASLTEVDGDTQEAEDAWRLNAATAGLAAFEDHTMMAADCEGLETAVYGPPIEVE